MLGLEPRDRRCITVRDSEQRNLGHPSCKAWEAHTCRADQFQNAAVVEYMRHPSSKRNDAGGNPAGSAIARWCQSSTTVC